MFRILINNPKRFQTLRSFKGLIAPTDYMILSQRLFAKDKDKRKENKNAPKINVNIEYLKDYVNVQSIEKQMQKPLDTLKEDFITKITLRSSVGAIENIKIKSDGKDYKLMEIAQIMRSDPKVIVVNLANVPQLVPIVVNSIRKAGMNLNPEQDGTSLFIPIMKVSKQQREQLSKIAKSTFIKCRDSIKTVQNHAIKNLKKDTHISADDFYNCQAQLTAIADKLISEAEKLLDSKQKELENK